jgi:hypothetical protein
MDSILALIKFISALVGTTYGVYKVKEVLFKHEQDNYNHTSKILSDLSSPQGIHPLQREKAFNWLARGTNLSNDGISYLLTLPNSDCALRNYRLGQKYLIYTSNKIYFRSVYSNPWVRRLIKTVIFALYLAVFFPSIVVIVKTQAIEQFLIYFLFSTVVAILLLREGERVNCAEALEREQRRLRQLSMESFRNRNRAG